jgi:hypothetical protein
MCRWLWRLCAKGSRRINHDIETGAMPATMDPEALAAHTMAVIQCLSTMARDGATREKPLRVATAAMRGWPAENWQNLAAD